MYGLLVCMFGHDVCMCLLCVLRVRTTVHTAIAQHICVDRFCACVMIRKHVTCATTAYCGRSIKLFKVNNEELFESATRCSQIRLSSDVVRRPSCVVVRRSCIVNTIASPCHRAPNKQNRFRNRRGLQRRLNRAYNLFPLASQAVPSSSRFVVVGV